jgi:hypothetical protein
MKATYIGPECKKCGSTERYLPRKHRREKTGACVACKLNKSAEWRKKNPELNKELVHKWRKEHLEEVRIIERNRSRRRRAKPEEARKMRARALIGRKIKRGELNRIEELKCRRCENQAEEYHHPDYDTPWLVIPLCRHHHQEEHSA